MRCPSGGYPNRGPAGRRGAAGGSGPEAVEQRVEHLDLTDGPDPPRIKYALRADAVDEHYQLVRGKIKVNRVGELTTLARLARS